MNLFNMDDLGEQLNHLDNLNYRIVDDVAPLEADGKSHEEAVEENEDFMVSEFSGSQNHLEIPKKKRRGSQSVDLHISEPFISSSVKNYTQSNYRPTLDDFEPIMVLGKGTYGKVLLVKQKSTGKLYAQKQLKKVSLLMNDDQINEVNLERTLNEKKILERVNHPNIVKLYYAFQDFDKVYLILEYLDGGELFYHLSQEAFLPEPKASYYIAQLILALRYLHLNLKVIYRDLKPENCMLNSSGNLVLTDFGLSKVNDNDKTNSFIGTIQYMAPEILKNEQYSYEVDWWSLGCISFDLLTGSPPFTGNNNKKITEKILASKKNLKFPFYLSLDAKDFLRKLLNTNIDKRVNLDREEEFEAIKKHRFFRNVNWKQLIDGDEDILPPILPVITNPVLAENFDKEFTEMAFTPPIAKTDDILHVSDFTFTNEKFLHDYFKNKHI